MQCKTPLRNPIHFLVIFLTALNGHVSGNGGDHEWAYRGRDGPEMWGDFSPHCGHDANQSPINIDTELAEDDTSETALRFDEGYWRLVEGKLVNNGHTLQFTPTKDPEVSKLTVTGGPLGEDVYAVQQFHFHWGWEEYRGSEHTIDRKRFPLEMHLVHSNVKNGTLHAGQEHHKVMVLSILFEDESEQEHVKAKTAPALHPVLDGELLKALPDLIEPNSSETINLRLSTLLNVDFQEYYHYQGSFTTPPCTEGVVWIVCNSFSFVTKKEIDGFRSLRDFAHHSLSDNFRPVQPLHHRHLYRVRQNASSAGVVRFGQLQPGGRGQDDVDLRQNGADLFPAGPWVEASSNDENSTTARPSSGSQLQAMSSFMLAVNIFSLCYAFAM